MVLRKDELELKLKQDNALVREGKLREDSPFDTSEDYQNLCFACRTGDLKGCQLAVENGVNINARDLYDNTPLILASLCGHYEVVRLLLEAGALCERDTFQGERCLYNALNNTIRNLLLSYDYSKNTDPLQPLASHITALLTRNAPKTSDICLTASSQSFVLHKFVLSARSPYFHKKLSASPETTLWKLAQTIPPEAFQIALRYLYMGDVPSDLGLNGKSPSYEAEVLLGLDKICKQLEIESLWEAILSGSDRRLARQRYQDEIQRGQQQIEKWYRENVLKHKIHVPTSKSQEVKWNRDNAIFADVLLRADEEVAEREPGSGQQSPQVRTTSGPLNGIPIGPSAFSISETKDTRKSILYPAHKAMLLRSEYFQTMFESSFQEAQITETLQIITVDFSAEVLEIVLDFLYTEQASIPIELAVDVLYAADMLFIEKLKTKAAVVISTIGGGSTGLADRTHAGEGAQLETEVEMINIYDVIHAAWDLKVQRLEEFSGRYLAFRLEDYIDEQDFEDLIKESAGRITNRQETDSIELLDDIRHYLSDRFRLRFEDIGLEEEEEEDDGETEIKIDTDCVGNITEVGDKQNTASITAQMGQIRTLGGDIVADEFDADAINYNVLLKKIDSLLEKLELDA